jgi:hypothetical protein
LIGTSWPRVGEVILTPMVPEDGDGDMDDI